jgi:hypothetical protein
VIAKPYNVLLVTVRIILIKNILRRSVDRVAQGVEHLPSKCEALSSNPGTPNFKKLRKKTVFL